MDEDGRSCDVCFFDPFGNDNEEGRHLNGNTAANLEKLRRQIRAELQEQQQHFAAYVDKKISEAMKADNEMASMSREPSREPTETMKWNRPPSLSATNLNQPTEIMIRQTSPGNPKKRGLLNVVNNFSKLWQAEEGDQKAPKGGYTYTNLKRTQPATCEPTELQLRWKQEWLAEVEDGELDVYTCLGLSNCFTCTAHTRKCIMKAVGAGLLQIMVPFCLLFNELQEGVQVAPAKDNLGYRLVGFTLYGYAISSMYSGAESHCRTDLLNLMFQYETVPMGNWLPLLIGEFSDVFTAVVLVVVLYSIFTTQTAPEDLIMNAIAVNFLCDVDSSFVDKETRLEAIEKFTTFSHTLFSTGHARINDPYTLTWPAKLVKGLLLVIILAGLVGCSCFVLYPSPAGGEKDVLLHINETSLSVGD